MAGEATELPDTALPNFPLHEEPGIVYAHFGNIVEDNIWRAVVQRWLDVEMKPEENDKQPVLFHSMIKAGRETRPTQRA